VFGGVEAFLDNEDVQQAIDAEISDLLEATEQPRIDYSERSPRPDSLNGVTQRVETGYGKLYVTINEDENGLPFELFANIGHSGGYTNSFTEALAKVISTALRSGVDPEEIVDELQGTRAESRVGQRRADPVDPGRDRHRASALPRRRCR